MQCTFFPPLLSSSCKYCINCLPKKKCTHTKRDAEKENKREEDQREYERKGSNCIKQLTEQNSTERFR